ncbi:MAG TPA: nuclear transport factor 2 family protein [Bryobacteraceae bacterium]|jgi:predicted SnoaL-like aldol condensation-catalyzing enzyme
MKRIAFVGLLSVIASVTAFGQAAPVVALDDPAAAFTDKDPVLNRNKQAAMHIVVDLLEYGNWNEANKWITDRYIQHNPNFGSGLAPVVKAFGARGPGRPVPASPKDWRTKVVAVVAEGDLVAVITRVELPDPRNQGQTYTTTHYDMWRFVNGKADEHWDEGRINPPRPPQ